MMKFIEKFDMKKVIMKLIFTVFIIMVSCGACSVVNKYIGVEDDNPVEELAEELILCQTGMEIDLTPESKE